MALDFLKRDLPRGYRSSESGQVEKYVKLQHSASAGYETIYTVPKGKTYYVSKVIFSEGDPTAGAMKFATGEAGSETDLIITYIAINSEDVYDYFIPLKFSAGTRLSLYNGANGNTPTITISGFEE